MVAERDIDFLGSSNAHRQHVQGRIGCGIGSPLGDFEGGAGLDDGGFSRPGSGLDVQIGVDDHVHVGEPGERIARPRRIAQNLAFIL